MNAYWIARCHVTDVDQFSKYAEIAGPIINSQGGRFLARGGHQIELEGGIYERTVLVEFSSFQTALSCYESDEYQDALKFVKISAKRHVVIIEGLPE